MAVERRLSEVAGQRQPSPLGAERVRCCSRSPATGQGLGDLALTPLDIEAQGQDVERFPHGTLSAAIHFLRAMGWTEVREVMPAGGIPRPRGQTIAIE